MKKVLGSIVFFKPHEHAHVLEMDTSYIQNLSFVRNICFIKDENDSDKIMLSTTDLIYVDYFICIFYIMLSFRRVTPVTWNNL